MRERGLYFSFVAMREEGRKKEGRRAIAEDEAASLAAGANWVVD